MKRREKRSNHNQSQARHMTCNKREQEISKRWAGKPEHTNMAKTMHLSAIIVFMPDPSFACLLLLSSQVLLGCYYHLKVVFAYHCSVSSLLIHMFTLLLCTVHSLKFSLYLLIIFLIIFLIIIIIIIIVVVVIIIIIICIFSFRFFCSFCNVHCFFRVAFLLLHPLQHSASPAFFC